ncbi:hypothetical protein [Chryseobacterium taichungense]|uniref:hypothetical protein n=1 Tax=Chryseobacterium taichungense TaxID=295069 RepID=UPI0028B1A62E|nr:hypothetical protein [Chryseobacterium taichungense]
MSDWLVNYEDGGFKRRGITGTVFFVVQDLFGISLPIQVFIVQVIFYALVFYLYCKLLLAKKIDWNILVLLCSPLCFMYFPINLSYSGKREIILFTLAAYFSLGKMTVLKEKVFLVLFCAGLLIHEMFYFFLPFFIAIHTLKTGEKKYSFWMLFFALSSVIMMILFFFGKDVNCGKSLEFIKERGVIFGRNNIFQFKFSEGTEADKERINFLLSIHFRASCRCFDVFILCLFILQEQILRLAKVCYCKFYLGNTIVYFRNRLVSLGSYIHYASIYYCSNDITGQ